MSTVNVLRYRVSNWLKTNEDPMRHIYGIQAKVEGRKEWVHVGKDGEATIFDEADDAEAEAKRLNAALK